MYRTAFLILTAISLAYSKTVKWLPKIPNASFNTPANFKNGKMPCSNQEVVFPENVKPVTLEADTSVGGLILPNYGTLYLAEGSVYFGPDDKENCEADNKFSYFLDTHKSGWLDPDVWSSPQFNEATPDAERIPCFDDVVELRSVGQFSLVLPDSTQYVSKMTSGRIEIESEDYSVVFGIFVRLEMFTLNKFQTFGVEIKQDSCQLRAGCPCQPKEVKINCSKKLCKPPQCTNPIQPKGHCCKICGGFLAFEIDQTFDIAAFRKFVGNIVESYGRDRVEYHIGRIHPDKVQLVVVDKDSYDGISAQVVNDVDYKLGNRWVGGHRQSLMSGTPLDRYGMGGKIFVSVFFIVVATIGSLYLYYYKLTDMRYPVMGRGFGLFSRFNQRSESVVSLTRRDSGAPAGFGATAFRNPLYDSRRGRVEVTETIAE